ncbi:hypothetical protein F5Y10DRAFT_250249 [Nemania abortiva]|nr:hypothetical protein F5Y10DRAFT_250249 [Nemania abortiva]
MTSPASFNDGRVSDDSASSGSQSDDLSDYGRASHDTEVEWDIAAVHSRNEDLKGPDVEEFFSTIKALDQKLSPVSYIWLRRLPYDMHNNAIPLFKDNSGNEDYQLHPSYSWLKLDKRARNPIPGVFGLSAAQNTKDLTELRNIRFFIPLGRLFVNARNGNRFNKPCGSSRSRITRWTGYEVFLSSDLGVWIVFDAQSLARDAEPWYPVSCGILDRIERFSIARLLPRFADLRAATFEDAVASVKEMHWDLDNILISEVEKEDGDVPIPQAQPQSLQS